MSPASTAENTPKRQQPTKRAYSSAADKWEKSIEKWDNSPKATRINRKIVVEETKRGHARTDSGSSSGSFVDSQKLGENVEKSTKEQIESSDGQGSCQEASESVEGNCQEEKTASEEESLSDIAEEDLAAPQSSALAKSFFSRNAPERLSSLFKRGVGGADQKIRGLLKKGIRRSDSKESIGSGSSVNSNLSSRSTDKSPSESTVVSPTDNTALGKSASSNSLLKSSGKGAPTSLGKFQQSPTDQQLFSMKGEQPRLFQKSSSSSEEFKTPPTSPFKKPSPQQDATKPVAIPDCAGRTKGNFRDPLGVLESPTNSIDSSTGELPSLTRDSDHPEVEHSPYEEEFSVVSETIYNGNHKPKSEPNKTLKYEELDLKPSTFHMTKLTPLSVDLPEEEKIEENIPQKYNQEVEYSSKRSIWSVTPLGSPFAVPIAAPVSRASTLPRSATTSSQITSNKRLPPLPPGTPNKPSSRQSRSSNKNRRAGGGRSSSVSLAGELCEDSATPDLSSTSMGAGGARTSNSLTSLSSISDSGQPYRSGDLAPRQTRTLDGSWSLRMLRYYY